MLSFANRNQSVPAEHHRMDYSFYPSKPKKKRKVTGAPIYQFDAEGKLIYKHANLVTAAENLFIDKHTINSAIRAKNFYHGKWYFSRKRDFVVPHRLNNPLFPDRTTEFFEHEEEEEES